MLLRWKRGALAPRTTRPLQPLGPIRGAAVALLVVAISYRLYPPPDPASLTISLDARVLAYERHSAMMGIGDCLVSLWLGLIGGVIATGGRGRSGTSLGTSVKAQRASAVKTWTG